MGFLDKARAKAADAVGKHGDKIDKGLDKAGNMADQRTQGKHTDKIAGAKAKATDALDNLDGKRDNLPPDTATHDTPAPSTSPESAPSTPPETGPAPPVPPVR